MTEDTNLAGGSGNAHDAQVITESNVAPLSSSLGDEAAIEAEAVAKAHQARVDAADRAVVSAQTKVEKQQAHLEGAQAALVQATAEREAI